MRKAVTESAAQADEFQRFLNARGDLGAGEPVHSQGFGNDVGDAAPRIERCVGILEDRLHMATETAQLIAAEVSDVLAHELDVAALDVDQTEQATCEGRFAAAGFAHDPHCFAATNVE